MKCVSTLPSLAYFRLIWLITSLKFSLPSFGAPTRSFPHIYPYPCAPYQALSGWRALQTQRIELIAWLVRLTATHDRRLSRMEGLISLTSWVAVMARLMVGDVYHWVTSTCAEQCGDIKILSVWILDDHIETTSKLCYLNGCHSK